MPRRPIAILYRLPFHVAIAAVLAPLLAGLLTWTPTAAVDHREAPLIAIEAQASFVDDYAVIFQHASSVTPLGPLSVISVPFDPPTWGDSSMLIELGDDIHEPLSGPVTVPVELTQLNLRSTTPITVVYPNGTTEQWDVDLGLSPSVPSIGTMQLFPSTADGGAFAIELPLYMEARFTRQGDGEVRTFDYGMQSGGMIPLEGSGSFSLACPPDRMSIPDVTTPFCLGHDNQSGNVFPVTLIDSSNPSNPRFSTRIEPTPANNPPVLNPIGNMLINEGQLLGRTFGSSDPDGDARSFSTDSLPGFCTLTDNGNGTASFVCIPGAGDAGVYTITIAVTDDGAPPLSDLKTFTLTVEGQGNRPPVLDPIGNLTIEEDQTLVRAIAEMDPDGDDVTITAPELPYFCTLEPGEGFTILDCAPRLGDAGAYIITITATDDGSPPLSVSQTFTLTVTIPNQAPVLAPVPDVIEAVAGMPLSLALSASDIDGDAVVFNASLPAFAQLFDHGNGTATLEFAPTLRDTGAYLINVSVSDDDDPPLSDGQTFTLLVKPEVDAGGPYTVVLGQDVPILARSPDELLIYTWDFDDDGLFDDAMGASVFFPTAGLAPGTYPVTVQGCAPDTGAGSVCNTGTTDVTVQRREWTHDDLRRLTFEYVDNAFVARGLVVLVDLAQAFDEQGRDRLADAFLETYMSGLRAITPRLLTPAERDELIGGAQALQQQ